MEVITGLPKITALADSIRAKSGGASPMSFDDMKAAVDNMSATSSVQSGSFTTRLYPTRSGTTNVASYSVTFPKAFPSANYAVECNYNGTVLTTGAGNSAVNFSLKVDSKTASGFVYKLEVGTTPFVLEGTVTWRAVHP